MRYDELYMNFSDPNFITLISLVSAVVILLIWVLYNDIRLGRILKGKGAKDLDDSMQTLENEIKNLKKFREVIEDYLENAEDRIQTGLRGIGIVRFNPWQGTGDGGNQSFAIAILSEKKDGVIISSLYSRERFSAFAKPIKSGKSEYDLTKEEKQALDQAIANLKHSILEK